MIEVYGGDTPNVFKVLIALQELGETFERIPVDIFNGGQFEPAFLAISPNNRVPAIVDKQPADGAGPLPVFESGAILLYLAEKNQRLAPSAPRPRSEVLAWLMWQMAGQGPMLGQAGHFRNYAPERIPYATERFTLEAKRLYRVLNTRLAGRAFIAGDYSIADIACWPWILFRHHHGVDLKDYPQVERWFRAIEARAAVQEVMRGVEVLPPQTFTDEQRQILFGQTK